MKLRMQNVHGKTVKEIPREEARPAGGLSIAAEGLVKICFLMMLCEIPYIPCKQSKAIYNQMNFCGSYSFVCEYGLRSDCLPKVSGNPGFFFYSTKCAAMREILKTKTC